VIIRGREGGGSDILVNDVFVCFQKKFEIVETGKEVFFPC
jgi:hypothetical protein